MPELPEVECVRRSLERRIVGRRIASVRVSRADVVTGSTRPGALLVGSRVDRVLRHGKQLAIVSDQGGCLGVHLGMSGQLCVLPWPQQEGEQATKTQRNAGQHGSTDLTALPPHTHLLWQFDAGLALRFTDPRRFGGVWSFAQLDELQRTRWGKLGPDALRITPKVLHDRLSSTQRALKAVLLDQSVVAGLGNIYVDELLYAIHEHPQTPANRLSLSTATRLVRSMRSLLTQSIERGGSSLRDYVDADNQPGSQQNSHRVYGRGGKRCMRRQCRFVIETEQIAGRTTAWCPRCQPKNV